MRRCSVSSFSSAFASVSSWFGKLGEVALASLILMSSDDSDVDLLERKLEDVCGESEAEEALCEACDRAVAKSEKSKYPMFGWTCLHKR